MAYSELLIGFDAREMWYYENAKPIGQAAIMSLSFFRNGIKKGLSIDPSIWGSVFDTGDCVALVGEERRSVGLGTLKLPDWVGPNKPFWDNLSDLEHYLLLHDSEIIKPYWIIAVTRLSLPQEIENTSHEWPFFEPTNPPSLLPEWKLIGFDIADHDGEARLTGTEFKGSEQYLESLRNRWWAHINEYHLFKDLVAAIAYKEFLNQQYPSYAQYFVYGIWLITQVVK